MPPMGITEEGPISDMEVEMNGDEDQNGVTDPPDAPTSTKNQSLNVHIPVTTWNGDKLRELGACTCYLDAIYSF
jgi:hypothetical protein